MKRTKHFFRTILAALTVMVMAAASCLAVAGDWGDTGVIEVVGMGARPAGMSGPQARMMARRAAEVDAQRQLAEAVNGVQVDSESTVQNYVATDYTARTRVSALIKGFKATKIAYTDDGGCEVTMVMPMYGSGSLAAAVLASNEPKESFPEPTSVAPSMPAYDASASVNVRIDMSATAAPPAPNSNAIGGYTGLIVDCRNMGLSPAMSPVIKNDVGEKIYGHKNLDSDYVVNKGMAGYTKDLNTGVSRAGSNPLVVKAVSVEKGYNPVVSAADANRILIENKASHFLDQTNVVFIR